VNTTQQIQTAYEQLKWRTNALISVLEQFKLPTPGALHGLMLALNAQDIDRARGHSKFLLDFIEKRIDLHAIAPVVFDWSQRTHEGIVTLNGWLDTIPSVWGHDNDKIKTVYDASKWNYYNLSSGERLIDFEFKNDWGVGIHHFPRGPLDDVIIDNLYSHDHFKWASRAYDVRGATVKNYTVARVEREHAWYWTLFGDGTHVSQEQADKKDAIVFDGGHIEDVDGQPWQLTGANPLDAQRLKSDECSDPIQAWSPMGWVRRKNTTMKRVGRGIHDAKVLGQEHDDDRVGFLITDFPYKASIWNENIRTDNTELRYGGGAFVCQKHPQYHMVNMEFDFSGVDCDKEHGLIEDTPVVRIKGGVYKCGSRKQVFIRRCGDVIVEDVKRESDADLYVDGTKVGKLSDGYRSI